MGALGQCLHEMRARRGLTLDEIAQVTRIGKRHLVALEAEDFSELPAPVFVKGFLRSYCDALQEPCDEALGLYRQTIEATAPSAPPIASRRLGRGGAASARRQPPARSRRRVPLVAVAALLVLLGLAAMAVQLLTRRSQTAGPDSARGLAMTSAAVDAVARMAPAAPPPLAPVAPGAGDSAGAAAAPPTSAESSGHRLVARTSEPTWLRVQADGAEPVQELLPAGVTREWLAARKFVLTIGNAGGVQLELNGRAVPPLGTRGAVIRDLVLPREEPARPSP